MKQVGFAGRSLAEMEHLWEKIQLFCFVEGGPYVNDGNFAWLQLRPEPFVLSTITESLHRAFKERSSPNNYNPGIILDNRLVVSIISSDDYYGVKIQTALLQDWQASDFDRLREIDFVLGRLNLPIEPANVHRAFFQGKIVECA